MELKPPLQALLIASDNQMKIDVMTGYKRITIREGMRDYRQGPVMLCDEAEPWVVKAIIIDVQFKTLSQVTKEEWKADGFTSKKDMLTGMRRFYPTMTMDSSVTVIKWDNVSGLWTKKETIEFFSKNYGVKIHL